MNVSHLLQTSHNKIVVSTCLLGAFFLLIKKREEGVYERTWTCVAQLFTLAVDD